MPETFLNNAQLTGLSKDARRTEILRAKAFAALPHFEYGTVTVPAAAAVFSSATITFANTYATAPVVIATVQNSGAGYLVETGSNTTTGCTVTIWRYNETNVAERTVGYLVIGVLA